MSEHRTGGTSWRRSSFCGESSCIEVRIEPEVVRLRDNKDPGAAGLVVTRDEWDAFVLGVKQGDFDHDAVA